MSYDHLPGKGSLDAYIGLGVPLGGFLTAVVENNLSEAVGQADSQNAPLLRDYVMYLYNECPSMCWGSREKVKLWYLQFEEERV